MLCSRSAPLSASGCTIVHAATRDMWRAREAHTRLSRTAVTSAEFVFVKVCPAVLIEPVPSGEQFGSATTAVYETSGLTASWLPGRSVTAMCFKKTESH